MLLPSNTTHGENTPLQKLAYFYTNKKLGKFTEDTSENLPSFFASFIRLNVFFYYM